MNLRRAWGQSKKKNASLGHHSQILILQSRKHKGKHNPIIPLMNRLFDPLVVAATSMRNEQ